MLHLIVGPWASGKSTLAERLAGLLPDHIAFDWDLIIPGLSLTAGKDVRTDASTWNGLHATWFAVIESLLRAGHEIVLCCPVSPREIPLHVAPAGRIRTAYIDCPDDELRERLAARGESDRNTREELAEAAELRRSEHFRLDGATQPDALARDAAAWVQEGSCHPESRLL